MTGRWLTFGDALGQGMAQGVNNYLTTTNTLQQQQQEQARWQQQQAAQEAARQQAQANWQQEFNASQATTDYNRQRQERQDGINDRENDLKTVLAPQINTFMEGVSGDLERYAPTLKDGSANPQYDPALYRAAQDRKKQALKLWSNVGLSVGHGEDWEGSKASLLQFIGGDDPKQAAAPTGQPAPAATPQVKSDPAQAAPSQGSGTPAPAPSQPTTPDQQAAAPQADPGQPSPTDQHAPKSVTDLTGAELLDMTDDQLAQQYGQGGLEWGRAKRAAYVQQVQAQQQAAAKIRAASWDTQLGELSKRTDLTGDQRLAMATISGLMAKPQLSDGEAKQLADSFALLTPKMYDATSWQKVLDSKDPAVILAQLPVYQKYAPDVVQGFDPAPFQQVVNDTHDLNAAKIVTEGAQAGNLTASANKTNVEADAITQKLPGEIANTAADTREKNANADKTVADAAGNRQKEVAGLLASFGSFPSDMSYDQILKQAGPAVQKIKDVLGIDDAGVANLIGQAQYKYSLGIKGEELKTQLAQAKVTTQAAQTGLIQTQRAAAAQRIVNDTAATNSTIAVNQTRAQANSASAAANLAQAQQIAALTNPKIAQIQAGIQNTQTRTAVTAGQGAANIALTNARTGQTHAQEAVSWANVDKIKSSIQTDQQRTAVYVAGVKGKYLVDVARAANLNSQTALNRAKNPNDPLYNPVVAASKPGDPVDALKKQANLYYTQADGALKTANTLQTQINSLVKQGTGVSGTFSAERLSPADQDKLKKLTAQRDKLMQVAVNRRNTGDGIITNGLNSAAQKTQKPGGLPQVNPNAAVPRPVAASGAAVPTAVIRPAAGKIPVQQRPQLQSGGQPLPSVKPASKPVPTTAAPLPRPQLKGNYAEAGPVFENKLADAVKKKDGAAINYFANQLLNMGYKQADIEHFVDKLAGN